MKCLLAACCVMLASCSTASKVTVVDRFGDQTWIAADFYSLAEIQGMAFCIIVTSKESADALFRLSFTDKLEPLITSADGSGLILEKLDRDSLVSYCNRMEPANRRMASILRNILKEPAP
jgi:hypothetical protein